MMDTAARGEFSTDLYLTELIATLHQLDREALERIVRSLCLVYASGGSVFCCGNGGSAAIAAHWATDLTKLTAEPGRPRMRVFSLTDSVSAITAAANDFDYSEVFVEQLKTFMEPGDIVIGVSTSGRSPNVLRAVEHANQHGGITIGITGAAGEPLQRVARETLVIASTNVQRVEDVAAIAAHLACLMTRDLLAEATETPYELQRVAADV